MLNGRIIKSSRTVVEGSSKSGGWSDHWDESFDIEYAGDLDCTTCERITRAFMDSPLYDSQGCSSQGSLRWPLADSNVRVDVDSRKVLVTRGMGLCD